MQDYKKLPSILLEKLLRSGYEFHFIQSSGGVLNLNYQPITVNYDSLAIQKAWELIQGQGRKDKKQWVAGWEVIDRLGDKIDPADDSTFQLIRYLKEDPSIIFVLTDFNRYFPSYGLNVFTSLQKINQGFIPIHASGVIHKSYLFLFGGISGSGKSTISRISSNNGADVLDEDGVMIKKISDGIYSANGWSYNLQECELPIKAVFQIFQAKTESLTRMTEIDTTKFLFYRAMEKIGSTLSVNKSQKVFSVISDFARSIPGYELHFRKSPDFWKLIDAEFGIV